MQPLRLNEHGRSASTRGVNFVDLDTIIAVPSDANALVIDPDEILRFLAPADFAPAGGMATPGGLSVRALDDTYVGGFLANGSVTTIDISTSGGDTAISESTA